uniref:Replication factor A C-terminal domain-containing protein n=1 Tax=Daucus carota subsp. sativus TaxID=79200 RepID=A0A166EQD1_DAUCS
MVAIWNNQKQDYFPRIKEGDVYKITDFKIMPAQKKFRPVKKDISLSFYHKTKVEPMEDNGLIPKYKFDLTSFEVARTLLWDTTNFIDIMGMVKDVSSLETTSKGSKKLDVLLVDDRNHDMVISLWEEKATHFMESMAPLQDAAVFVIITGLLAKQYSGNSIILSSGDPTKCYFNLDYDPLKELMGNIQAITGHSSTSLPPPTKKRFVSTEDNIIADATIQTILDAQLPDDKKVMRFVCEATIVDISKYDGWYYNSCPTCPRTIRFEHGNLYCDECTKETGDYVQRYKITIHVKDDTAKTTFTLFNKEAQRLIGAPIQTIIAEIGQDKITSDIPVLVKNVKGKKCVFEVKVTIFNLDGREGYTVARLSEVTDQPPSTSNPPETLMDSPRKKKKLA